ncbi:hypothetical protein ABZ434_25420 [Streptomyces sp. NPDC005761]|uniref:hypothetical protein n=1 Tax=unclassified Streptomyces TaxID=2593676 RepID=UPI0033C95039
MEPRTSPDQMPAWIPATGHALRHAGIHFDAVRIIGILGEQVAYELMQFTDFRAGPIVRSRIGDRSMCFLLRPGSARAYRWPVGAEALVREGAAFVGVPAVHGLTYPLDWRSLPDPEVPFVDAELLFELLREVVEREKCDVR